MSAGRARGCGLMAGGGRRRHAGGGGGGGGQQRQHMHRHNLPMNFKPSILPAVVLLARAEGWGSRP